MTDDPINHDYTAQERAALVAWNLAHGEGMTTANVAITTGLTWRSALDLMNRLSRVLPIAQKDGVWQVCALAEMP